MATYKAEFLSHYYGAGCGRAHAYAFGLIYWWARLASLLPRLVNFITHTPGLGAAGQVRRPASRPSATIPRVRARRRSSDWFAPRAPRNRGQAAGDPLARHLQQPLPPADRQGGRRGAGGGRASRSWSRRSRSAAAGRSTTTACSTWPRRCSATILDALRPADPRGHAGRRARAELRGRLPRRAGRTSSRTTRTPGGSASRRSSSASSSSRSVTDYRPPKLSARRWCTGTATTRPSSTFDAENDAAREARPRLRDARLRLLRHGRRVRLRGRRALRRLDGLGERVLLPAVRHGRRRTR